MAAQRTARKVTESMSAPSAIPDSLLARLRRLHAMTAVAIDAVEHATDRSSEVRIASIVNAIDACKAVVLSIGLIEQHSDQWDVPTLRLVARGVVAPLVRAVRQAMWPRAQEVEYVATERVQNWAAVRDVRRDQIAGIVSAAPGIGIKAIARQLDISTWSVRQALALLKHRGAIWAERPLRQPHRFYPAEGAAGALGARPPSRSDRLASDASPIARG